MMATEKAGRPRRALGFVGVLDIGAWGCVAQAKRVPCGRLLPTAPRGKNTTDKAWVYAAGGITIPDKI